MSAKIEVTHCTECVYFIKSSLSNVGHCTMWNKGTANDGYCYRAETELPNEEQCVSCGSTVPEGRQVCPNCERGYT